MPYLWLYMNKLQIHPKVFLGSKRHFDWPVTKWWEHQNPKKKKKVYIICLRNDYGWAFQFVLFCLNFIFERMEVVEYLNLFHWTKFASFWKQMEIWNTSIDFIPNQVFFLIDIECNGTFPLPPFSFTSLRKWIWCINRSFIPFGLFSWKDEGDKTIPFVNNYISEIVFERMEHWNWFHS